ncbi:MAG: glycoside hydrolase [Chloroflexota bacterium]|nr:glycoside hydrolase [Chloroflexota bacterium]
MSDDFSTLIDRARAVLKANDLGASTKPAPSLYPHQWNWDSCFIAIGISRYDTARAALELQSLLRGQWDNGLVPQIVFNPEGTGYFPGPEVWQSDRSPHAPRDVQTSGITQPPVLATAALKIWENASDQDLARRLLAELYPSILKYHRWLYTERDPDGSGLVVVVHPWESGLDNSPPYLDAGGRVTLTYRPKYERLDLLHVAAKNRPTNKDYDLFVYLLEQMRAVNWDQRRYLEQAPLQVIDVLFNSILSRADADLAAIAEIVGEDPSEARAWRDRTVAAINGMLWDDDAGTYFSYDRVAGKLLKDDTIAAFHTLYGGVAPADRAQRLIEQHLLNPEQYLPSSSFNVPTTAINSPWFNPENYWLGPVWVNTNWMILHGLEDYGRADLAEQLRLTTLGLVQRAGFREYFNPLSGEGYGTDSFGWTAALSIDLMK